MTIQSMIEVATARPYLEEVSARVLARPFGYVEGGEETTHHVKMYWAWLFRRFTSAALPKGMPRAS